MFLVGTIVGSFVCCQAMRARLFMTKKKKLGKRSVCLSCGYQLRWYDNIPIISWLVLGGKCRKCGKKIGVTEILSEVLFGLAFLAISLKMELGVEMGLTLILVGVLGYLAIYDGKWGELPVVQLIVAVIIGALIFGVKVRSWEDFGGALIGVGILAGIYYLLYFFSREKLVGGGDWILGLAIALAVADWWAALWVLFLANAMGTFYALPAAIKKKQKKIHFGPFLVAAYIVVILIGF